MDRSKTIALFRRCEDKRENERYIRKREGLTDELADDLAHEAAKKVWNEWATPLINTTADTAEWEELARADFSKVQFVLNRSGRHNQPPHRTDDEVYDVSQEDKELVKVKGLAFRFDGYIFPGKTNFEYTEFYGCTWFSGAVFHDIAVFEYAEFHGTVSFGALKFNDYYFGKPEDCWNKLSKPSGEINGVHFSDEARFWRAQFHSWCIFLQAQFEAAKFQGVRFHRLTSFSFAHFNGEAHFEAARFARAVYFKESKFMQSTRFFLCHFSQYVSYDKVTFYDDVEFRAIQVHQGFSMEGTKFARVPNFIQAIFEEVPRLDNIEVNTEEKQPVGAFVAWAYKHWLYIWHPVTRRPSRYHAYPAHFRALRYLAIRGHDIDRELQFHASEIRYARGITDHILHWKLRNKGIGKFWFGLAYQFCSGCGRSLLRPFLLWLIIACLGTVYYLGESPDLRLEMREMRHQGISILPRYWSILFKEAKCYQPKGLKNIASLPLDVSERTSLLNEAIHLSLHNAFVVLNGSADANHRTYGCLYGIENHQERPFAAVVPSRVSNVSFIQKFLSAVFIFLFGFALRNMLRVK